MYDVIGINDKVICSLMTRPQWRLLAGWFRLSRTGFVSVSSDYRDETCKTSLRLFVEKKAHPIDWSWLVKLKKKNRILSLNGHRASQIFVVRSDLKWSNWCSGSRLKTFQWILWEETVSLTSALYITELPFCRNFWANLSRLSEERNLHRNVCFTVSTAEDLSAVTRRPLV